ncbi:MAG: recombinase family protein [Chloroflexota bacterium]
MKARRVLRESDETLKEGYGFANQRDDCVKFENELSLEIVKEHLLVESSSTWDREKFDKIISEAIQERVDVPAIEFPRVDRFARNLEAAGYYLGLLRQNGLVVMFSQEHLVVNNEKSSMTVLIFFIHSFKADQDGKQIRHNLLGGRDRLATEGQEVPNGMVMWPFDYVPKRIYGKISSGKPIINKDRAAWVKKWVGWIREEGLGLTEIQRRMRESSASTRRGRKLSLKAIRDILRSKQLIGKFEWKGKEYLNSENLRILTDEEFQVVQKILDDNSERSFYNATKFDYPPLRKMVFHRCGQLMYRVSSKGKRYYRCPNCKGSYIDAQELWDHIQREIKGGLLTEERLIPAIREQFNNKDTSARLEQEIKAKANEIQKWDYAKDAAFRMGMTLKNYSENKVQKEIDKAEENMQRLKVEKADLDKKLNTLTGQKLNEEGIRRLCQLLAKNIDSLTKNQWEVLNKLIKLRVTVYNKRLVNVNVSLPPARDMSVTEIEFSRL